MVYGTYGGDPGPMPLLLASTPSQHASDAELDARGELTAGSPEPETGCVIMTIVKWIAILLVAVYLGGLVVLYVRQREMLFPIPPAGRTAPDAAGLPEAEEHVLPTSDGD